MIIFYVNENEDGQRTNEYPVLYFLIELIHLAFACLKLVFGAVECYPVVNL